MNESVLIKATNINGINGSHMPLDNLLAHLSGIWGVLEPHTGSFLAIPRTHAVFPPRRALFHVR